MTEDMYTKRLDSLLADQGFCSRRRVADFLLDNNITINGKKITEPGTRVSMETDELIINDKIFELKTNQKDLVYYVVNKPKGILAAASDNAKRRTVVSFVPSRVRVYPIGRLDEQSTGLILLTNDGDLAHKLTNPRYHIHKKYFAWVVGTPSEKRLGRIREGMMLQDGRVKPVSVTLLKISSKRSLVEIVLNEGNNHQIRKMFARVGINIVELKRIAIGPVLLDHLGIGKYRELNEKELSELKAEVETKVKEFDQSNSAKK